MKFNELKELAMKYVVQKYSLSQEIEAFKNLFEELVGIR